MEGAEGPAPPGQPAGAAEPVLRGTGTPRALLHRQDLPPHRLQAQPQTEVPHGLPVPLGAVRHREGRQGWRDVCRGRRQTLRPVRPGRGARIRHVNHALQVGGISLVKLKITRMLSNMMRTARTLPYGRVFLTETPPWT